MKAQLKEGIILFSYIESNIWKRTVQIGRVKICYRYFMGYFFWLVATEMLYAWSHNEDSTYHIPEQVPASLQLSWNGRAIL